MIEIRIGECILFKQNMKCCKITLLQPNNSMNVLSEEHEEIYKTINKCVHRKSLQTIENENCTSKNYR